MTITTISQSYSLMRVGFKREDADFCYIPLQDGFTVGFNYRERREGNDYTPAWSIDQLWEEVHKLDYIYDFDSTQSATDLIADLVEIIVKAREGNNV